MSLILLVEQTLNGLQFGVMLFLMAAGLTLVFGVMGLINLAHGSLYMIGAFAAAAMAQACAARGIPFLHVSTDYVFDGSGDRPWREDDPVGPLNAYGRSKLAGEAAVRAAGGRHVILRTSWVFSAEGANFLTTMLRLSEPRDSLSVVADQLGGPTPAAEIAATLLRMAAALCAATPQD